MPSTNGLLNAKLGASQVKKLYRASQVVWELWTPSEISTLFWHDAADSSTITAVGNAITQVNDKSGNGYNLTVAPGFNGPLYGTRTLNGLGLIEYTGDNCLENTSFTHNQNLTPLNMAMVFSMDDTGSQYFIFAGRNQQPNPTAAGTRMSIRRRANSNAIEIIGGSNTGSNIFLGNGAILGGETPISIFKFNGVNSEISLNGSSEVSGNIGTNAITLLQFGHNESEGSDLDGYFAEIIAFTDNSKQEMVEGYLAWKWGLQANLPALHPYKDSPPLVDLNAGLANPAGLEMSFDPADSYDATIGGNLTTDGAGVARLEDSSGNARHLTQSIINARPLYINGSIKSLTFNMGDHMTYATPSVIPNEHTISVWYNKRSIGGATGPLIANWQANSINKRFALYIQNINDTEYEIRVAYNTAFGTQVLFLKNPDTGSTRFTYENRWRNVVVVTNSSNFGTGYVDAYQAYSDNSLELAYNGSDAIPLSIGSYLANNGVAYSTYFYGEIGRIKIYNTLLTQTEITDNYNNEKGYYGII